MPKFQLLIEFEDSLAGSADRHATDNLLRYLQTRIQWARLGQSPTLLESGSVPDPNVAGADQSRAGLKSDKISDQDIERLYREYRFGDDEFHSCKECGRQLCAQDRHQQCCLNHMETSLSGINSLSKTFYARLILDPISTIKRLPHYTEFLCLQQGIPNQLRRLVWSSLLLLGAPSIPQTTLWVFDSFQHSYSAEISKQISKDLHRTFPTISFFTQPAVMADLEIILNVYANYDAELGYCQGLLFLVGVLYYNLGQDCALTLHGLISVMETEPQLRAIFVALSMRDLLTQWRSEFLLILEKADPVLHQRLQGFIDFDVFLTQWWMSFMSSHTPDLMIVNRVMDFCILQGWKTGMLKISLGVLVSNRHILISLSDRDEEVAYQLLLGESRWGPVMGRLDVFFGNLLFSWDETLFPGDESNTMSSESSAHRAESSSMASSLAVPQEGPEKREARLLKKLKLFSFNRKSHSSTAAVDETQSVFSKTQSSAPEPDMESVYSEVTNYSIDNEYRRSIEQEQLLSHASVLEELLRQAYFLLDDAKEEAAALKETIANTLDLA